jgi:hypothetical protein
MAHPPLEREDLKKALRGKYIHSFNSANIEELRFEIEAKLEVLEMTYGIKITTGRISWDNIGFRCSLKGSVLNDQSGLPAEQANWNRYCKSFSFLPTDYGRKFIFPDGKPKRLAGKVSTIYGINPRAKSCHILVRLDDGGIVRCPAGYVRQGMK